MEKKVIENQKIKLDVILYLLLIGSVVCLFHSNQGFQKRFAMIVTGTIFQAALDSQGLCEKSLACIRCAKDTYIQPISDKIQR